uniref:CST complex subunit TEN1 n=1 Tax=Strix occidentalis caurina TaxID=311401 RepID=A0A8D0FKK8_STROC
MKLLHAGVYYFPWEINSSVPEGEALRTFGRLCCYDLVRSEAVLTAQHSSAQYRVCVDTKFVEPFQCWPWQAHLLQLPPLTRACDSGQEQPVSPHWP